MKTTEFLIHEHKLILRALDVLDAMAAAVTESGGIDKTDTITILHFLRWFADEHHQAKEERILFPALKTAAASQQRHLEHLALEHEQERALIEKLEKNLRLAKLPEFAGCANRLCSTLRNHIYKEDHILFERVDAVLNAHEDHAVFEQLKAFDTPSDEQALQNEIANLRQLEWKYLNKSA